MSESVLYITRLLEAEPLRRPVLRTAIEHWQPPRGSRGLDAGCGIGLQMRLLADAIGPAGHVTGVDFDPALLAYGEDQAARAGLTGRMAFQQADVSQLPFEDNTFDWAWSADCIGYPAGDLAPLLDELIRVVKPGGSIAILGWTSQQILPGHPLLEARLNATCSAYIPFLTGKPPEQHFLRALRAFRAAGLDDVYARTFPGDIQAPLSGEVRTALVSLFEMLWPQPQPDDPGADDWQALQRLCRPESPDFILDDPDYYMFFTVTMFNGSVPR